MLLNESVANFIAELASRAPTPGGGGASALVGALSAALASMMANLTLGKEKFRAVENDMSVLEGELAVARSEFLKLMDEDAQAYNGIMECYALPKNSPDERTLRAGRLAKAAQTAALVPLKVCDNAVKVLQITEQVAKLGNPGLLTDAGCAAILGMATFECAELNVRVNLPLTHNKEFITDCENKLTDYRLKASKSKKLILQTTQMVFGSADEQTGNIKSGYLQLNPNDLLGVGCHKKCYRHPADKDKCVEIVYTKEGLKDIKREKRYRRYMAQHPEFDYSMLPVFYGECETNMGHGYIYERIVQPDGSVCPTFRDYFQHPERLQNEFDLLVSKMKQLKQDMLTNEIITMNITEENIAVQTYGNDIRIRLLSDLGSSFFLPIDYEFRSMRLRRVERHWQKMCDKFIELFPVDIVKKFAESIR